MKRTVVLVLSLLLVMVLSIGCGKGISIPTGDGGSMKISKDGLTVKDSKGEEGSVSFSSDQKLPKDFPSDIPIPKKSTIEGSFTAKSNGKKSFTVTLSAKGSVEELTELYESFMEKKGYEETAGWGDNSFYSLSGFKDGYLLSVMISDDGKGASSVVLSHAPRE